MAAAARSADAISRPLAPAALFVLPVLSEGGSTRLVMGLAGALTRLGSPAQLLSVRPDAETTLDRTAITEPVLFGMEGRGRIRSELGTFLRRLRIAARRADVVVSGEEMGAGLDVAVLAGFLAARPVIVIVHSNLAHTMSRTSGRHRHFVRWAYPRLDGAVLPSCELAPTLAAVASRPPRRVRWIPSGIDIASIRSAATREPDVALPAGPIVVAVGRLVPEKGLDTLIRAHAAALGRGRQHCVVLVGDGPERAALERLARSLDVARSVVFLGHCSNPHAIVARSALFCFPSRCEGMGLALLEALAVGAPIVAADCVAGPSQILDRGAYGDLVRVDSTDDLSDAIVRHLDDPERLRRKAATGTQWAETFTLERCAQAYQAFFREIMGAEPVGAGGRPGLAAPLPE